MILFNVNLMYFNQIIKRHPKSRYFSNVVLTFYKMMIQYKNSNFYKLQGGKYYEKF